MYIIVLVMYKIKIELQYSKIYKICAQLKLSYCLILTQISGSLRVPTSDQVGVLIFRRTELVRVLGVCPLLVS